jgi:formylglycine-generating enzyme required for sulfatase activity
MDLLRSAEARSARARVWWATLATLALTAGCVKPLRFEDLDAAGGPDDTGTLADDTGTLAEDTGTLVDDTGTLVDDTGTPVDDTGLVDVGALDSGVSLDAGSLDANVDGGGASDAGVTIVPTSCVASPDRDDCLTTRIEPTGTFCIGVDATAENAGWNASPPLCGLSLSPFFVDRTEVSVARFRAFYERWRTGALSPSVAVRFANGLVYDAPLPPRGEVTEWSPLVAGCNWSDSPVALGEQHPINCVGWSLAMYFCGWEGGHLVTSTEYEYLARWHRAETPAGRAFPWGDVSPSCDVVQYGGCTGDDGRVTRRVGAVSVAPQGVFDLAGNVADFVADDFAAYATLEVSACWTGSARDPLCLPSIGGAHYARGSNYMSPSEALLRSVFRPSTALDAASPVRGFRCAYTGPR